MTDDITLPLASFITSRILRQPDRQLQADEALISSGLIDSFSLVDLALFVEETFYVHIADTELNADTFDTLRQLVAIIQIRQSH